MNHKQTNKSQPGPRVLIISPVRNEAEYLQRTIDSIVSQSLRPVEWVIVDDGSTDATPEILAAATREHSWIRVIPRSDRGHRAVGPGVVEAFYDGLAAAQCNNYDYVCKLDGDLEIPAGYFKRLMQYFAANPGLGAASGKPYLRPDAAEPERLVPERMSDDMVAGMINCYRRDCFEAIGGFVRQVHWDGIAFHACRLAGYQTRSMDDPALRFVHLRLMGSSGPGIWAGRQRWGRGQYFMGTHPLYLMAIVAYRALERPLIYGGLGILLGYLKAWREGMPRHNPPGFRADLHEYQLNRLLPWRKSRPRTALAIPGDKPSAAGKAATKPDAGQEHHTQSQPGAAA